MIVLSFFFRNNGEIREVMHFLPRIGFLAGMTLGLTQYDLIHRRSEKNERNLANSLV